MTKRSAIWLFVVIGFLLYGILTWFVGTWLDLSGWYLWTLRGGLWLLGLAAAGLLIWFFGRPAAESEIDYASAEIDATFEGARRRLGESNAASGMSLSNLPMIVVVGPQGSAKTTTIVNSGLDPDLLAGDVFRGTTIAPTGAANLWYSNQTIFAEMGGSRLDAGTGWGRFMRRIQPKRLQAAMTGRQQAPRVAVVCFSCEEFVKAGSSEAVPAAGRALRERLTHLARSLGIQLPVYAVFTKADRLPHFPEFVRNLAREETQEILGATLRKPASAAAGTYTDQEHRRLHDAFLRIFHSLAEKRLKLLPRETQLEKTAGIYEFPREFRKITDLGVQFLVELCKPSQLAASPFLRGFYFTGVRAVIVSDAEPARAPQPQQESSGRIGATQVFDPFRQQAPAPQPSASPSSRKVPQWIFLNRLFRDVILADRVAMGITRGGVRLNVLRRLLLSSALAAALLLGVGLLVSFVSNKRLQNRTTNAARAIQDATYSDLDVPPVETMRLLENLRAPVAELADYEENGPRLRLRWGLYSGNRMLGPARRVYYTELDNIMLRATRASLLRELRTPPVDVEDGGDKQREYYNNLKAYLMTTEYPDRMDASFLPPVLTDRWLEGRQVDPEQRQLGLAQLAFYAGEQCDLAPCVEPADTLVVEQARNFLEQASNEDNVYRNMLTAAAGDIPPIQFDTYYEGASNVISNPYVVPGEFTDAGHLFMQDAFARIEEYVFQEAWVVPRATEQIDLVTLEGTLRDRYRQDYIRHWQQYLEAGVLSRYTSVNDALNKIGALLEGDSPLLTMLELATEHTAVDTTDIGPAFQPVHLMSPPGEGPFASEVTGAYIGQLEDLQRSLEQLAASRGDQQASNQASQGAQDARRQVQGLTRDFSRERGAGTSGAAVRNLMLAPFDNITGVVRTYGLSEINTEGRAFCRQFDALAAKFPMRMGSQTPATVDEMNAMFGPENSLLMTFYQNTLEPILVRRSGSYVVRADAPFRPTQQFVDFFNRAIVVSEALWRDGSADPWLNFTFRPTTSDRVTTVILNIDGEVNTFTRNSTATPVFSWNARRAQRIDFTVEIDGQAQNHEFNGTWGLFRMFHAANGWNRQAGIDQVEWRFGSPGSQVAIRAAVNLGERPQILRTGYLETLQCVGRVVR